MAIIVVVLFLFFLLLLGAGGLILVVAMQQASRKRGALVNGPVSRPMTGPALAFRWRYVMLPALIFITSVVVVAFLYRWLPAEVGYRFAADGSPDRFVDRGVLVATMVVPQLLLVLLAASIAFVVVRVGSRFTRSGDAPVAAVEGVTTVMSNMVVLPQIVLLFAMGDVFSYNAFQFRIVETWLVALVVLLLGGLVLAIFFFRAIQLARSRE